MPSLRGGSPTVDQWPAPGGDRHPAVPQQVETQQGLRLHFSKVLLLLKGHSHNGWPLYSNRTHPNLVDYIHTLFLNRSVSTSLHSKVQVRWRPGFSQADPEGVGVGVEPLTDGDCLRCSHLENCDKPKSKKRTSLLLPDCRSERLRAHTPGNVAQDGTE